MYDPWKHDTSWWYVCFMLQVSLVHSYAAYNIGTTICTESALLIDMLIDMNWVPLVHREQRDTADDYRGFSQW